MSGRPVDERGVSVDATTLTLRSRLAVGGAAGTGVVCVVAGVLLALGPPADLGPVAPAPVDHLVAVGGRVEHDALVRRQVEPAGQFYDDMDGLVEQAAGDVAAVQVVRVDAEQVAQFPQRQAAGLHAGGEQVTVHRGVPAGWQAPGR